MEEANEFQKNFCFGKAFDCVDHNKLWEILKEMGIPETTLAASWETCMKIKRQQLEPDKDTMDYLQIWKGVH